MITVVKRMKNDALCSERDALEGRSPRNVWGRNNERALNSKFGGRINLDLPRVGIMDSIRECLLV
jgi:hypothetical protein